jgi:hypothetical protein
MRFLRERVDDDNAFSSRGHIDGARNSVLSLHAHFPEFPSEMPDVRFAHRGEPMRFDEFRDAEKPLSHVLGQSVELTFHSPIQDLDTPIRQVALYLKKEIMSSPYGAKTRPTGVGA